MKVFYSVMAKVIENLDRFIAKTAAEPQKIGQKKRAAARR
jgi:hypothetical protein